MSLFAFRTAKAAPGKPRPSDDYALRVLDGLTRRVSHSLLPDLPESAAWGVSPIDKYFDNKPVSPLIEDV